MFDEPVRSVMRRKPLTAAPETFVRKAAKLMAARRVGSILIVEDHQLVGIFTERDMLVRVVARGLDAQVTRIADVMTRAPVTIDPDKPFGYALLVMHENGFRHLPVVEGGKLIGTLSSRSAMDPDLEEFSFEARRRTRFAQMR